MPEITCYTLTITSSVTFLIEDEGVDVEGEKSLVCPCNTVDNNFRRTLLRLTFLNNSSKSESSEE